MAKMMACAYACESMRIWDGRCGVVSTRPQTLVLRVNDSSMLRLHLLGNTLLAGPQSSQGSDCRRKNAAHNCISRKAVYTYIHQRVH